MCTDFQKISPLDSQENSLCGHRKDFHLTCNMLLHYLVKVENPKMLLIIKHQVADFF